MIALLAASSALAGRDLECSIQNGENTINGIRSVRYHKEDHHGVGELKISRFGSSKTETVQIPNGSELYWGENIFLPRGTNYSVEEFVTLNKSRDSSGKPRFMLVTTRRTLSGDQCDGFHSCSVRHEIVNYASITCTDSDDSPRDPSESYRCDPTLPGDCE
jgi:hypothetical protein